MKNQNYLRIIATLLFLSIFGCEKEAPNRTLVPDENANKIIDSKIVSIEEVSDVLDYLQNTKGIDFENKDDKGTSPIIDVDNVLQVTDSLRNTNYSLSLVIPGAPENVYYNLVIGIDSMGNKTEPMVIKYAADNESMKDIEQYGSLFPYFRGKIGLHRYTDYFDVGTFGKAVECPPEHDEFGDPIPCEEEIFQYSGGGSASTGDGGPAGPSGPGSGSGGTESLQIRLTCDCVGHTMGQIQDGQCTCSSFSIDIIDNSNSGGTQKSAKNDNCPGCDETATGAVGGVYSIKVNRLKLILQLPNSTDEDKAILSWLQNRQLFVEQLLDFMQAQGWSPESKLRVKEAIVLKIEGHSLVSLSPFMKYPKNSTYATDYPKLTELLKTKLPDVKNNQSVIDAINDLTDAPKEVIKEALEWGKGPEIRIIQLHGEGDNEKLGSYRGHVNPELENVLFLDVDLVEHLEDATDPEFTDALAFLVAVTVLHEYTHLGDNLFSDNFWGNEWVESEFNPENEAGRLFEEMVFGEAVWISNAGVILKRTGGL